MGSEIFGDSSPSLHLGSDRAVNTDAYLKIINNDVANEAAEALNATQGSSNQGHCSSAEEVLKTTPAKKATKTPR